jgi:hypothetical protein
LEGLSKAKKAAGKKPAAFSISKKQKSRVC